MYINKLLLINFRNYEYLDIDLINGVNIFVGDNAQGKTNILEAIYYCCFAKSHRTSKDKELVNWKCNEAYIKGYISKNRLDKNIEIKIFKQGKKGININKINVTKISQLIGVFNVVMFSPEDLKIVKESPSYRRKFLDMEISQINNKYYYNLVQYNKVLSERNSLLKNFNGSYDFIDIYDKQLCSFGSYIIKSRIEYISKLNEKGEKIHFDITNGKEKIHFKYVTTIKDFHDIYNDMLKSLIESRQKDIERNTTLVGPHRDDFSIEINNINTRNYGSQGQQRTSILTIKFSSLEIIKDEIGEYPVLLLDDVLSELDENRQKYILRSVDKVQTIITCTGITDISSYLKGTSKIFNVKNGKIKDVNLF